MEDTKVKEVLDEHAARRRALLKNAGKVAVTAPAVSLLLAKGIKPASAQSYNAITTTEPFNCLLEGSLVLAPNGRTIPVDACRIGQPLASFGGVTRISDVWRDHLRDHYFVINDELRITNDHPVLRWTPRGPAWNRIDRLDVGDAVMSPHGRIAVRTIERVDQVVPTVYIETEHDTFLAHGAQGPYVVHGRYAEAATVKRRDGARDAIGQFA